jgi:hypothetical protein
MSDDVKDALEAIAVILGEPHVNCRPDCKCKERAAFNGLATIRAALTPTPDVQAAADAPSNEMGAAAIASACAICIDDDGCHPATCSLTQQQVAKALVLTDRQARQQTPSEKE